ncbi:MAG: biotin--[acetyl-CoA-carboxylase] ligase [Gammaproteobacteria bacterium]|nr:biotin--[acetyl-CoA-carboxylase] ligase [Gammaproteobacteria bacterium]
MEIESVFDELAARRVATVDPADTALLRELAAAGVSTDGNRAYLADSVELLSAERIRAHLAPPATEWLRALELAAHIPSTNTELVRRGSSGSIDGTALLAEVQTAGRGRRGRSWRSPFARNLALSVGIRIDRGLVEVGAVSLVVGVAVADALAAVGVDGVALKWPNDVLLEGRKLSGILTELPRAVAPPELVVGIGINVGGAAIVAREVDQGVADVTERVPDVSRNRLAGEVIDSVFDRCRRFEREGFEPLRSAYDALHGFHGETVRVVAGTESVAGVVLGVAADGALRLRTASGERRFSGGEVSLRA